MGCGGLQKLNARCSHDAGCFVQQRPQLAAAHFTPPFAHRRALLAATQLPNPPPPLPCLPRRKLEVAVREENYSVAAEAKREIELLTERLPANQLLLATLLERLDKGGLPEEEATAVVRQLGELGEW